MLKASAGSSGLAALVMRPVHGVVEARSRTTPDLMPGYGLLTRKTASPQKAQNQAFIVLPESRNRDRKASSGTR